MEGQFHNMAQLWKRKIQNSMWEVWLGVPSRVNGDAPLLTEFLSIPSGIVDFAYLDVIFPYEKNASMTASRLLSNCGNVIWWY